MIYDFYMWHSIDDGIGECPAHSIITSFLDIWHRNKMPNLTFIEADGGFAMLLDTNADVKMEVDMCILEYKTTHYDAYHRLGYGTYDNMTHLNESNIYRFDMFTLVHEDKGYKEKYRYMDHQEFISCFC